MQRTELGPGMFATESAGGGHENVNQSPTLGIAIGTAPTIAPTFANGSEPTIGLQATGLQQIELQATAAASASPGTGTPSPLLAPSHVGRFAITSTLGAGAMGVVYRAHDPNLRRDVAIKVVKGTVSQDATERMLREAQVMAQLDHANAVRVYEVGHDGSGNVFIAMEFIEGTTLRSWLENKPSLPAILHAFSQAANGLSAGSCIGNCTSRF